jgi:hypothetical protein
LSTGQKKALKRQPEDRLNDAAIGREIKRVGDSIPVREGLDMIQERIQYDYPLPAWLRAWNTISPFRRYHGAHRKTHPDN